MRAKPHSAISGSVTNPNFAEPHRGARDRAAADTGVGFGVPLDDVMVRGDDRSEAREGHHVVPDVTVPADGGDAEDHDQRVHGDALVPAQRARDEVGRPRRSRGCRPCTWPPPAWRGAGPVRRTCVTIVAAAPERDARRLAPARTTAPTAATTASSEEAERPRPTRSPSGRTSGDILSARPGGDGSAHGRARRRGVADIPDERRGDRRRPLVPRRAVRGRRLRGRPHPGRRVRRPRPRPLGARTGHGGRHPLPSPEAVRRGHEPPRHRRHHARRRLRRLRRRHRRAARVDAAGHRSRRRPSSTAGWAPGPGRSTPGRRRLDPPPRSPPHRGRPTRSPTPTKRRRSPRPGRPWSTPAPATATGARPNRSTPAPGTSRAPPAHPGPRTSTRPRAASCLPSGSGPGSRRWAPGPARPSSPTAGRGSRRAPTSSRSSAAGFTDRRLFVASWSGWSADPDRPVATGGRAGARVA